MRKHHYLRYRRILKITKATLVDFRTHLDDRPAAEKSLKSTSAVNVSKQLKDLVIGVTSRAEAPLLK